MAWQRELAEKAGVSHMTITRVEGGSPNTKDATLRAIMDVLGMEYPGSRGRLMVIPEDELFGLVRMMVHDVLREDQRTRE